MAKEKRIDFVKLNVAENLAFWRPYIKSGDYEAAGKEVIAQAWALFDNDTTSNERAASLLTEAKNFQERKAEAGRKGGKTRARNAGETLHQNQSNNNQPKRIRPPTKEDVYDFAHDHNLDEADARNWFEQNYVSRPGCHKDGEVITNWKGSLTNHCKKEKAKREQQ